MAVLENGRAEMETYREEDRKQGKDRSTSRGIAGVTVRIYVVGE